MRPLLICLSFLIVAVSTAEDAPREPPVYGILGAMPVETRLARQALENPETSEVMGVSYVQGELGGVHVVLATSGMGKVNAAMVTTLLLDHWRPQYLIFTGIAGGVSADTDPGDLVVAEQLAHYDYGRLNEGGYNVWATTHPATGRRNPVYLSSDAGLLARVEAAARSDAMVALLRRQQATEMELIRGTIASGDTYIASESKKAWIVREFDAKAVEMEGAAVAQICHQRSIPFLVVRGISDRAGANSSVELRRFIGIAADRAGQLVVSLVSASGSVD